MDRKNLTIAALAVIAAVSLVAAASLYIGNKEKAAVTAGGEQVQEDGPNAVLLTEAEMKEFGVEVGVAGPGKMRTTASLPGEVVINADRQAHVVPRIPGIVREVRKNLGDHVRVGEVMAVIDSRELADAKSAYLAARERTSLGEASFRREEGLWQKKISSEQEYLDAKRAFVEAGIEQRSAEQKLRALGFSDEYLKGLPSHSGESLTSYAIVAPFGGTVVEKHIALGETLREDTEAFVVADLGTVWVNLSVYQKDQAYVRRGQKVVISAGKGMPKAEGIISYIASTMGEETRTATARVVLPNPGGQWRPGLFVTADITVEEADVPLLVHKSALQTMGDETVVFVRTKDGFEPRRVSLGRTNDIFAEVMSGIEPGQPYVTTGGFTLKSELEKGTSEE